VEQGELTVPVPAAKVDLTGAQRAAILVMYLDQEVVKRLLEHLSTDELREIGLAMASVETIDPVAIESVVADFVRDLTSISLLPSTGKEYALGILPSLIDEDRRERIYGTIKREVSTDFRDYISTRPPRTVATILQDEHPQTQAIALLLAGPDNAAKILEHMDDQDRYEIAIRMTHIEQVPGELADDVEVSLRGALEDRGSDRWKVSGLDRTAQVLGRLGRPLQEPLLSCIAKHDRDLSETIRRRMVVFDDLSTLDNRSIQALLKNIDRSSLLVALRGADPTLRDMFLSNMSSRAASDLREELEIMGPVPRSEVNTAQEEIVQVALGMQEEGIIRFSTGGAEDEMV